MLKIIYSYVRPLYDDKKLERQLQALNKKYDVLFKEAHGTPKKRTELEALLMKLEPGDTVIVEKMVVLADTFHHLIDLLQVCEKDQVTIHFIKEGIQSDQLLQLSLIEMMERIVAFQSDIIKQSTALGMKEARKSGKSIGRPKKSDENVKRAIEMYHEGFKLIDIKQETGISKSTLYRYLEAMDT